MDFENPKLHNDTLWSWLRTAANILSGTGFPSRPPLEQVFPQTVWMPPTGPDEGGGWALVPLQARTFVKGWASVVGDALGVEYATVLAWARGRSRKRDGAPRKVKDERRPSVATLHALLGVCLIPGLLPLTDWRAEAQRRGWSIPAIARMFHVTEVTVYRWVGDPPLHFALAMSALAAGYPIPEAFHEWSR